MRRNVLPLRAMLCAMAGISLASPSRTLLAQTAEIRVRLRDSQTGFRVYGLLESTAMDAKESRIRLAESDRFVLSGDQLGRRDLSVTSATHKPLSTHFYLEEARSLDVTVWLDPIVLAPELSKEAINERHPKHSTLVHGHVIDGDSGEPLGNAGIVLEGLNKEARSNDGGYFAFAVDLSDVDANEISPLSATLRISRVGYGELVYKGLVLAEDAVHLRLELQRGALLRVQELKPGAMAEGKDSDLRDPQDAVSPAILSFRRAEATASLNPVSPPDSIRVGFNCATGLTCATVSVYSLETSPFKVTNFNSGHLFRAARIRAVDTCGIFGSKILSGMGFLGPR